jgi:hypothetical protein
MLSLVSVHIVHLILEINFYLCSHNDCILQDFKAVVDVSTEDLKWVQEILCKYIIKETIDRKWQLLYIRVHREFIVARNVKLAAEDQERPGGRWMTAPQ